MNAVPTTSAPDARDLNAVLSECFALDTATPPFPRRIVEFAVALTGASGASAWEYSGEDAMVLRAQSGTPVSESALKEAIAGMAPIDVRLSGGRFFVRMPFAQVREGVLVVAQPSGGPAAQSLAYERLMLMAHMAKATFTHPTDRNLHDLTGAVAELSSNSADALQKIADRIATMTGAEFAAIGTWTGTALGKVAVSGQVEFAPRSPEMARIRNKLTETVRRDAKTPQQYFAKIENGAEGYALLIEAPTRGEHVLPLAAALLGQQAPRRPSVRPMLNRWFRRAAVIAVLFGLALLPVRDGAKLPAHVVAVQHRVVTAPLTAVLREVKVENGQAVEAGTPVLRLEARDAELELIRLQSERAAAVIDQETARLKANAAGLRNAELQVARLDAQITLEQDRVARSVVTAPIAGVVILNDLGRRIGTTVQQAEALMEITDPDVLELQVSIPDRDIGRAREGDAGRFRPDFDPSQETDVRLLNISPAIDLTEALPVTPAIAEFSAPPDGLRPGLTGVLLVNETRRPIWTIVYSRLRDWIMLRVWF